jgi:phospholipid/cholesterol/gamma-HCH transport system substrate-binding protein
MRARRFAALIASAAAAAALLTGCSSGNGFQGIYSLPLPGGPSLGPHPYTVKAEFTNVADLVPHADVRVNDVAVGQVTGLTVPPGSWTAVVTMEINGSVRLPANAIAELTATSLLGEEYVALTAPPGGGTAARLTDGATIGVQRTTANATVEQVLGALSMLLNGGGLPQIHTITTQLNDALSGNEPQIRSVLSQITTLTANLNARRTDITQALDGLKQLSITLNTRDQQIGYVLDHLSPGLTTLNAERGQLVAMLNSLHTLSDVATATINASQANAVADLKLLQPILNNLADAGEALPDALPVLLTYPFPDTVTSDVKGDYLNAFLNVAAKKGTCVYAPLDPANEAVPASPSAQFTCPPQ